MTLAGLRPGEKLYEEKLMAEEGLKKTPNDLIHIGCPIPFEVEGFLKHLQSLMEMAYVCYVKEAGKTCPTEILEAIASINAEGRPIWKPMHMQPIYRLNPFIVRDGNGRARSNAYIAGGVADVGMDIFARGLCLPSDNKMTAEQQDRIIEVIKACFE